MTGSATPPGTVTPITTPPVETTHPVVAPDIKVEKISNPASGTSVVAGNTITYTLKFTNNGTGDGVVSYFDDLRGLVDDAKFNNDLVAQPDLTATANAALDGFTVAGPLKAGDTRTVTYTATVNADGARGDSKVLNVVIPGTTPPVDPPVTCDPATQICTENPVVSPNLEVVKTANPATGTT
ncbi:hypothetical protein B2J88_52440, partial [Rhodococcus sp. SRB_17]|nr:hypothetical protein [Rhodococcus sp. SRB_17]